MDISDLLPLLGNSIIQGLAIGVFLGFLFKIASKIIKIFFFIQFLLFKWLESRGILIIDWNRLTMGLVGKKENLIEQSESLVTSLMEMGTFGMSIMIGIFLVSKIKK